MPVNRNHVPGHKALLIPGHVHFRSVHRQRPEVSVRINRVKTDSVSMNTLGTSAVHTTEYGYLSVVYLGIKHICDFVSTWGLVA